MQKYIKKKSTGNLGFRTPDFFKQSRFNKKGANPKFNQSQFKTQHKG